MCPPSPPCSTFGQTFPCFCHLFPFHHKSSSRTAVNLWAKLCCHHCRIIPESLRWLLSKGKVIDGDCTTKGNCFVQRLLILRGREGGQCGTIHPLVSSLKVIHDLHFSLLFLLLQFSNNNNTPMDFIFLSQGRRSLPGQLIKLTSKVRRAEAVVTSYLCYNSLHLDPASLRLTRYWFGNPPFKW